MRRVAVAAALVSLVAAAPAAAQEQQRYPWGERIEAAGKFAKARTGRVSWAVVLPDGRVRGQHIHARHRSASVVKAMLLVAYLKSGDLPRRALRSNEKAFLRPMIVESDDDAANRAFNVVGSGGLARLGRRVRMKDIATSPSSWSRTRISPYDQTRLFYRLDAYMPRRHRAYARALLSNIVDDQRWGIPPAAPSGWQIYFKGGWMPPRVVNQVGVLERDDSRIAIAVFTQGNPTFTYGQATIEGVARRLLLSVNDFAL